MSDEPSKEAIAFVRAMQKALPDGWVIVPKEPTLHMVEVAQNVTATGDCIEDMASCIRSAITEGAVNEKDAVETDEDGNATNEWSDA